MELGGNVIPENNFARHPVISAVLCDVVPTMHNGVPASAFKLETDEAQGPGCEPAGSLALIDFSAWVAMVQVKLGLFFAMEHPEGSLAWSRESVSLS